MLPHAFEKSDAKVKYGGENVFQAMMGGRSLRVTGESVYSSSCMDQGADSDDHQDVEETAGNFSRASMIKSPSLYDDVGGTKLRADVILIAVAQR